MTKKQLKGIIRESIREIRKENTNTKPTFVNLSLDYSFAEKLLSMLQSAMKIEQPAQPEAPVQPKVSEKPVK